MSEGVKHKIYDYEVTPPERVWEKIATALDESGMQHQFPSTLYGMEVTPPPRAWDMIREALDQEEKVILPAPRKISPFLRYAVAAILAGLILFASLQIFKKPTGKKDLAGKEETAAPSKIDPGTVKNDSAGATEDGDNNLPALQPTQEVVAKLDNRSRNQKRNAVNNYSNARIYQQKQVKAITEYDDPGSHNDGSLITAVAHADTRTDNKNRYVMLMTPDGNIIRMSKKLGGLVCCVSGQEQDADCKSQLKIWQEKMASSIVAPSAGNFLDIVNLVNTLQGVILNNH